MPRVYVSIGSNIDRERNILSAVRSLQQAYGPLTFSRVYESDALGFKGGPFYNLVVAFDTGASAVAVSEHLTRLEDGHGRVRDDAGWKSRTLDLDLLLYDNLVVDEPGLKLPRPDIEMYAFVLRPLAEIAPDACHPVSGRRFAQMWREFDRPGPELRPVPFDPGLANNPRSSTSVPGVSR